MVKAGEDFVVYDAKTNEDITRSVLTQIIFEQENKEGGQNLLPINFLRQLIRFYGDSMQMMVPRYLEVSIDSLTREQAKFREQISQAFGMGGFGAIEDQVRRNMEMFERTFAMFAPFARQGGQATTGAAGRGPDGKHDAVRGGGDDIDDLKRQIEEMQKRSTAWATRVNSQQLPASPLSKMKRGRAHRPSPLSSCRPRRPTLSGRHALASIAPRIRPCGAAARQTACASPDFTRISTLSRPWLRASRQRLADLADVRHRLAGDIEDDVARSLQATARPRRCRLARR